MKAELFVYTKGEENLRIIFVDVQSAKDAIERIKRQGGYWSSDARTFFPYHSMMQFEIREIES